MNKKCRFCESGAVGRFALDRGCLVYPEDRVQDLCWHHARRATPLGSFEMVEDYTLPGTGMLRLPDLMISPGLRVGGGLKPN